MSFLEKIDKKRAIKHLELMLEVDKLKHKKIYVGDDFHRLYLKSFMGDFDYRRFMVESVLLRLMADKASIKRVNKAYLKIYDSLEQVKRDKANSFD